MRALRVFLAFAALASFAALTTACNTVEGFGRDLERGGEKLQGEADEHR